MFHQTNCILQALHCLYAFADVTNTLSMPITSSYPTDISAKELDITSITAITATIHSVNTTLHKYMYAL